MWFFVRPLLAGCVVLLASAIALPTQSYADTADDWLAGAFKPAPAARTSSRKQSKPRGEVQTTSFGGSFESKPSPGKSLSGGGVTWIASSGCLNSTLRSVVHTIGASYGRVTVSSTCRSHSHNRRVGGAPKSHHLTGDAVDFRVHGNYGAAYAYLRSNGSIGGVKHYGGGLFHIDTGPKRSW